MNCTNLVVLMTSTAWCKQKSYIVYLIFEDRGQQLKLLEMILPQHMMLE